MRLLLFCFLCGLSFQTTFAQNSLDEKMKWYALAKPTSNLFVHFDKNVYSNNETVYFTGYIIKEGRIPTAMHKLMSIVLIREVDSALIAEDKFIMSKGLSFGSLTIPDSIPTGNYRFLVYTDKLITKIPELLFIQNITIKSSIDPSFKASVKLMEQAPTETRSNKILVSTSTIDGHFLPKPTQINYSYGNLKKSTVTDASGQSIINLPIHEGLNDPNLYVKLKYGTDSTFISMGIPQPKSKAQVKFYPEGGNMITGLISNVAWEVKDLQNRPMALKAFLYKNQEVIDTIETGSYGIGNFKLKPEMSANYSIKLVHSSLTDTTYNLPSTIDNGLTIMLQNALVKDTLTINLKSTARSKITLLVHNFKNCFLSIPFNLSHENTRLKLSLEEVPKGLTTLTILDSLNRPLTERMFFAHYNSEHKIRIDIDKYIYTQREKVNLKLNLKADENAVVSIAVVQNNRLELKKTTDIESYTYLLNELSSMPISINGRSFNDRNYLEQVLLVKGWRRYTWQDLINNKTFDPTFKLDSLRISGRVNTLKKALKAPFVIGTMGSESVHLIPTTPSGSFDFNHDQLITPFGKKMYVFVNGGEKIASATKVEISNTFSNLNQYLASNTSTDYPILPSTLVNNAELVLKNNEKTIRLKEVIITKTNDNSFHRSGANACGDYVCPFNILNCRNHIGDSGNREPVKGVAYTPISGSRSKVVYEGCVIPDKNLFTLVKGIHLQKEFYQNDYKDPNEPAFFSTIYWNYGALLNSKKETELSFYTSDITGKFRIVVQGVSNKDVVYAEHFFEVKEK
ncbi:MAG: hypothetical protein V4663_13815 [Bacteroidota bacterium]